MNVAEAVPELLGDHPLVASVELTGSRALGTAHDLSDWDFVVTTHDFPAFAKELPTLVSPLHPLAAQWDPYARFACYMLILRGPTKVDLIFGDEEQSWGPPREVSAETLVAVDTHFWDWILWLEQKRRSGKTDLLGASLADLHRLLLQPMGALSGPASVAEAVDLYLELRARLEARFGVVVPRELEREVRPVVS